MSDEANILATLARVETQVGEIQKDVSRLATVVVDGNHVPPLVTRVDRLEVAEKQRGNSGKKTWAFIIAIVGALSAGVVSLAITLASNGF